MTNTPAHSGGTNNYNLYSKGGLAILTISSIWLNSIDANVWTTIGAIPATLTPKINGTKNLVCGTVTVANGSNGDIMAHGRAEISSTTLRIKVDTAVSSLCGACLELVWFID